MSISSSDLEDNLLIRIVAYLRARGKGYGVAPILWNNLWRFLETNADAGDRGLPPGADEKLIG